MVSIYGIHMHIKRPMGHTTKGTTMKPLTQSIVDSLFSEYESKVRINHSIKTLQKKTEAEEQDSYERWKRAYQELNPNKKVLDVFIPL